MNMQQETVSPYADNYRHLVDEFKRLDLYIRRRMPVLGMQETVPGEEPTGPLQPVDLPQLDMQLADLTAEINTRVSESLRTGVFLALPRLAQVLGLSVFEGLTILICLAPELRPKYEKMYAYLQDDTHRKKPGIDMILDLLCEGEAEKWQSRGYFSSTAPLCRHGVILVSEDGTGSLKLAPRFLAYIAGQNLVDEELIKMGAARLYSPALPLEQVPVETGIKSRITGIIAGHFALPPQQRKRLVLHFHGPAGVGKRELALGLCAEMNAFMLYVDIEMWQASGADTRHLLRLALRERLLLHVVVFIDGIDVFQADDSASRCMLKTLAALIDEYGGMVILAGEYPWTAAPGLFGEAVFHSVGIDVPGIQLSTEVWQRALAKIAADKEPCLAEQMANRYRYTPGQIQAAVESAYYHDILGMAHEPNPIAQLTTVHLAAAARRHSSRKLTQLAAKIDCRHGWDDIVLPVPKIQQLKEICVQVKNRHRVFEQWGFGRKISRGGGLSIIFTGSPGTGKTMAAEVMAGELQLDLYKIDLSGVVSKYIGETEKNLSKIFHEAETSNVILFFDEADALFGKRSEVNDAHDRYANIETSYLLQKMEEYEGIVILATNFRKNMDDAFMRRIRYVVEFPFPDEDSRERIWESHFPALAPRSGAVDFKFLARHFPITGGYIKNIVLDAAFRAAGAGAIIGMEHLLLGVRQEYEKIGKLWDENLVRIINEKL